MGSLREMFGAGFSPANITQNRQPYIDNKWKKLLFFLNFAFKDKGLTNIHAKFMKIFWSDISRLVPANTTTVLGG